MVNWHSNVDKPEDAVGKLDNQIEEELAIDGLIDDEDEEIQDVALNLIRNVRDHGHLANAKIKYAFMAKKNGWKAKGKTRWGQAIKLSAREKFLTGYDLMVIINKDVWEKSELKTRTALVDHELSHFIETSSGLSWETVSHDVEDFIGVVARHGAWTEELDKMFQVGHSQLDLFKVAS